MINCIFEKRKCPAVLSIAMLQYADLFIGIFLDEFGRFSDIIICPPMHCNEKPPHGILQGLILEICKSSN